MPSPDNLRRREWDVVDIPLRTAQRLVADLHYAQGGPNTGTFIHGLIRRDDPLRVWGAAWWLPPTKVAAQTVHADWRKVLSLSRLAIVDEAPRNAASFLLGRSIRAIERDGRFEALVTYADTLQGHTGAIYRATNWVYVGLTPAAPVYTDGSGRMVSRKAGPTTRLHREMLALGCTCRRSPGKHKFVRVLAPRRDRAVYPLFTDDRMAL